jgi:hypothetical protein
MVLAFNDSTFGASNSTAVSGGGVTTWQSAKLDAGAGNVGICELWWGVTSNTGSFTITVTNATVGATDFTRLWAAEIHASSGATWSVTTTGAATGSGLTFSYPSLTGAGFYAAAGNEDFGTFAVGSTAGTVYTIVDSHLMTAYLLAGNNSQPNGATTDAGASIRTIAALFTKS